MKEYRGKRCSKQYVECKGKGPRTYWKSNVYIVPGVADN